MTSEFARTLIQVGPHDGAHRVAARAGLSVAVPLALCVMTGHASWTMFAAFGAFTSLYGRHVSYAERSGLQTSVAVMLVTAVGLGSAVGLLPGRQWWVILIGALLAAIASFFSDAYEWHPPGPLFVVFAFSVCAMAPPSASNVGVGVAVAAASAAFSVFVGHVGVLRDSSRSSSITWAKPNFAHALHAHDARVHRVRFFLSIAGAGLVGTVIGGPHPYWAMVAAVAGMSGPTRTARAARGLHRLFGTLVGVAVAGLILPWHPRGLVGVAVIALLQVGAELFVARNYAIALLFITPMALMMGQLVHERAVAPLLADRAAETLIGCLVSLAVLLAIPDRRERKPKV